MAWTSSNPGMSITRARKTQALNDALNLQSAIERYYREYGKLPEFGITGDEARTDGKSGIELLKILMGKEDVSDHMQNPRQIAFLNTKESKSKSKGGLVFSGDGSGKILEGFYDAWGQPFYLKFDTNLDQEITDPLASGAVVRNKVAIVYSYGRDGAVGNNGKAGVSDDIKTW